MVVIAAAQLYLGLKTYLPPEEKPDLEAPATALGQAVATTIHQAVTDPYFAPLEHLVRYLNQNPSTTEIPLELMTKWAPDDEFPTCFVLDVKREHWQIDKPSSPWVLEGILDFLRQGRSMNPTPGKVSITTLKIEGETWWIGYLRVPPDNYSPNQIAGVFFSIDEYLAKDVPRLIDAVVDRPRFPVVPFQKTAPSLDLKTMDGYISFCILDDNGEVYLRRGRNFNPKQMIYSEKLWYDQTVVCLQSSWDLQIFSAKYHPPEPFHPAKGREAIVLFITWLLASAVYWGAVGKKG